MNGQPPPLSSQPPIYIERQGIGCFAKGCLTLLIIGFIVLAGMIGTTWYIFTKVADRLTSREPIDLQIAPPNEAQVRDAERSVTRVKTAIATGQETTVAFTAADLNALLDRDPDFSELRGRTRIDIANSIMTITMSAPLGDIPLPGLRRRWFNASVTFSFAYESGMFGIDIKSAEANGYQLPDFFLSNLVSSFNEGVNQGFHDEIRKNNSSEFWDHVKSMKLDGDKLVVTTENQ